MPLIPFVKTGYLGTNRWIPLVNGNGLTAGGGEPVPEIVWVKVSGTSPLSLPDAIANSIKSLTQYGLCTQASTPTPSAPVDIMCNNGALKWNGTAVVAVGTPEVLTVGGKNEANVEDYSLSFTNRYYVDKAIGVTLEAGVTYTFSCDVECSVTPFSISAGVGNDLVYLRDIVTKTNQTNGRIFVTFTPTDTALSDYSKLYVRIPRFTESKTGTISVSKIQLERSSSATDYEPHVQPQTVNDIPMLLSVGDYKDEAEIISGAVTHKCGIKVFDGTEDWTTDTYGGSRRMVSKYICNASGGTLAVVCSHYIFRPSGEREQPNSIFIAGSGKMVVYIDSTQSISTVDDWKAFIAAQYAAGTPVIVLYPLATDQTEQTTPHALHTSEGDNVVSVESSVDPVELECEYANGYE